MVSPDGRFVGYPSNLDVGEIYTLDNRRFGTYRMSGRGAIPTEQANLQQIYDESWKFTTKNKGRTARPELNIDDYRDYLRWCKNG
jgi:hypothetical protein